MGFVLLSLSSSLFFVLFFCVCGGGGVCGCFVVVVVFIFIFYFILGGIPVETDISQDSKQLCDNIHANISRNIPELIFPLSYKHH